MWIRPLVEKTTIWQRLYGAGERERKISSKYGELNAQFGVSSHFLGGNEACPVVEQSGVVLGGLPWTPASDNLMLGRQK